MYGSLRTNHCLSCKEEYTREWMKNELFFFEGVIPICSVCGKGVVKPDILLYNEPLPPQDISKRIKEFQNCDLLIIIGAVSYTHLRAHETPEHLVCRLLLEKK